VAAGVEETPALREIEFERRREEEESDVAGRVR
jgi:hypothetical protein